MDALLRELEREGVSGLVDETPVWTSPDGRITIEWIEQPGVYEVDEKDGPTTLGLTAKQAAHLAKQLLG